MTKIKSLADLKAMKQSVQEKIDTRAKGTAEGLVQVKIAMATCGIAAGAKMLSKHAALAKEQNLKDLYCYDRSLGHYWKLRRELTNEEWLEIDKRKKNGERLSDILDDMRVLD